MKKLLKKYLCFLRRFLSFVQKKESAPSILQPPSLNKKTETQPSLGKISSDDNSENEYCPITHGTNPNIAQITSHEDNKDKKTKELLESKTINEPIESNNLSTNGEIEPTSNAPKNDAYKLSDTTNLETAKTAQDKNNKKPGKNGGRRQSDIPLYLRSDNSASQKIKRAGLICFEHRPNEYVVAVEIHEDIDTSKIKVVQDADDLPLDTRIKNRYILSRINKTVVVHYENNEKEELMLFDGKNPLIFQTRKNSQAVGRRVKKIGNGHYVVFASTACVERKKQPQLPPANTVYGEDILAHYFTPGDDEDGFKNCPFIRQNRFTLKGTKIADDTDMGDIFTETPTLCDSEDGRDVSWIVVGEEEGKQIEQFKPQDKSLSEIIGTRNSGWFFIRIYDEQCNLVCSEDFRLLKGLAIKINGYEKDKAIYPSANGHKPTRIIFDAPTINIEAEDGQQVKTEGGNAFLVHPHPDSDVTRWRLRCDDGKKISSSIVLPRIWWKLGDNEWRSTPIKMSRQDFRESEESTYILLARNTGKLQAGLADSVIRTYTARKCEHPDKKNVVELLLSDFRDDEIVEGSCARDICLTITLPNEKSLPIIRILSDITPPPPMPFPIYYDGYGQKRRARGFSHDEMRAVGCYNQRKQMDIKIDKRRKTKHGENINFLKEINEGIKNDGKN